jgi:CxxC-x17-CxxC domain-containing protein
MGLENKTLNCADCGTTFSFSASEQEFFQSKGYTNEPKRCPSCRQARKSERTGSGSYGSGGYGSGGYGSGSYGSPRQMFPATCASCGKQTEVPFEPRSGRPVYCSDCYRKVKPSR